MRGVFAVLPFLNPPPSFSFLNMLGEWIGKEIHPVGVMREPAEYYFSSSVLVFKSSWRVTESLVWVGRVSSAVQVSVSYPVNYLRSE